MEEALQWLHPPCLMQGLPGPGKPGVRTPLAGVAGREEVPLRPPVAGTARPVLRLRAESWRPSAGACPRCVPGMLVWIKPYRQCCTCGASQASLLQPGPCPVRSCDCGMPRLSQVQVRELRDDYCEFVLSNTDPSVANALRRIMLVEVTPPGAPAPVRCSDTHQASAETCMPCYKRHTLFPALRTGHALACLHARCGGFEAGGRVQIRGSGGSAAGWRMHSPASPMMSRCHTKGRACIWGGATPGRNRLATAANIGWWGVVGASSRTAGQASPSILVHAAWAA